MRDNKEAQNSDVAVASDLEVLETDENKDITTNRGRVGESNEGQTASVSVRYFLSSVDADDEESGSNQRSGDGDGDGDDDDAGVSVSTSTRPGVQRINGVPNAPSVPEAYPVYPVYPVNIISSDNINHRDRDRQENTHTQRIIERDCNTNSFLFPGIMFIVILTATFLSLDFRKDDLRDTRYSDESSGNNTFNNETFYSSKPTLAPSGEISSSHESSGNDTLNNETFYSSKPTPKCFLDPLEIYMFEEVAYREGIDPSIPRTYHICPNSHLRIKFYDHQLERFDENSGDYDSFVLFRPNVSIKCGFDGSFDNNCTISGGLHHVVFLSVSVFEMHKILDTSTENVTFEGFTFTGARDGTTIANQAFSTGLTLRNCVFSHNYDMFTSILSAPQWTIKSTLTLENCTFKHNTYKFYHVYLNRPNIGVIASFPANNSDAIVNTHILNTVFRNNTFLLDDKPETIQTLAINDNVIPEDVYVNGAIINLLPAWGVLDITDSCFVGNKGYTNSLIIMDKDNRTLIQNAYGNYFAENEPKDVDEVSCILLYQNISYVDGIPMSLLNKEENCSDHLVFENDNMTNAAVCSLQL